MTELALFIEQRMPRTNMFVMATIYSDTLSAPAKIRNLYATGALIEGDVIPPPGTMISLVRGSLTAFCDVVWRSDSRAGLKFESAICVVDWLPNGRNLAPQQRVDEIVQQAKNSLATSTRSTEPKPARVGTLELARATKLIEDLADSLSEDPEVIARHGSKVLALDLAIQLFGKLAAEQL